MGRGRWVIVTFKEYWKKSIKPSLWWLLMGCVLVIALGSFVHALDWGSDSFFSNQTSLQWSLWYAQAQASGGNSSFNQSLTDALYVPYINALKAVNLSSRNLTNVNMLEYNQSVWSGGLTYYIPCGFSIQSMINIMPNDATLQLGGCTYLITGSGMEYSNNVGIVGSLSLIHI